MATYTYFYTVSAYSDFSEYFDTAEQGTITEADWIKYSNGSESIDDQYVPAKSETTSTTAKTVKIKKQMKVTYYLRYYMKKVDGATTSYYWLNDDAVKNVKVTAESSAKFRFDGGVQTIHKGSKGWVISKYPATGATLYGQSVGDCFVFTLYANGDNVTLDKGFTVTANVTPSNYQWGGAVIDPSSTVVVVADTDKEGIKPTIQITKGTVVPTANSNFLTELQKQTQASEWYYSESNTNPTYPTQLSGQMQYVYAYDACTKVADKAWVGVKWGPTVSADRKLLKIKYTVIYGSKDGQTLTVPKTPSTDTQTSGKGYVTSPGFENALELVVKARTGICGNTSNNNGGVPSGDNGDSSTVMVRPTPPEDKYRWNPPPHVEARGINFSYRLNDESYNQLNAANGGITKAEANAFINELYADAGNKLRRGRIFQDAITAKVMNTQKISAAKGGTKQWGFEFMYNPESIGYETTDGSGVDWSYGSIDKAVVLSGSQNISFDLLINRIPDMSYLRAIYGKGANQNTAYSQLSETAAYGRGLDPAEVQGILKRGTEYDIEFLYRVLTGDPLPNSLLLDDTGYGKTGLTADVGYITKVPIWLYLHENMRMFGAMGSMGVRHIIFDQNMVPMLSRLSITFSRYPASIGVDPNEAIKTKSTAESTGN